MQLNTPPPGASRAVELVPAVLRATTSPPATAGDALGAMLRGSQRWESVAAPVTRTVTVVSWLLLALDVVGIFVTRAFRYDYSLFGSIITWNHNPAVVVTVTVLATVAMVVTAVMTAGLRRANLTWLRVWIGGAITSVVAIAAMLVALFLLLLLVAVGIAIVIGILFVALDG